MDIALLHDVACHLVHEICMEAPLAPACDRRGSVLLGALFFGIQARQGIHHPQIDCTT